MRWMSDCALARSSLSVTAAARVSGLPSRVVSRGMFTRLSPRHVVTTQALGLPAFPRGLLLQLREPVRAASRPRHAQQRRTEDP
jgi:hypothetical protein